LISIFLEGNPNQSDKGKGKMGQDSDVSSIVHSDRCTFDKENSKSVLRVLAIDARNPADIRYVLFLVFLGNFYIHVHCKYVSNVFDGYEFEPEQFVVNEF